MIQGAINQLLTLGAAAKRTGEMAEQKAETAARVQRAEQRAVERHEVYMHKALKRAQESIQQKYRQTSDYKKFMNELKNNKAPQSLKEIAFEQKQRMPEVRIGKEKIDPSRLSPELQDIIRRNS